MFVKKCKKACKEEGGKTAMEKDARGKALSVIYPGVKILLTAIMVLLLSFEANAIYYYISLRAGCLGEHAPKIKSGSPVDGKVYDKDGTLIPVDYCVQYIYAGPDETIELPQKDGSVAATDVLLTNNSTENFGKVGYDTYNGYFGSTAKGTLPEPGMFYHQVTNIITPPDSGNNPRIYVRVWNAKTPAEATRYAQSAAIVVPMGEDTPPLPKEAPLPKMTTDLDKPTDDPKAPLLVLDPSGSITFNATVGVNPSFTTVKLKNTGTADLVKWTASKTSTWLKISPVTGSLAMGAETIMVISAEVGGLPVNNTYTDDIVFQSDGGNPKINVVLNIKESTVPAISKVDPKTNVNPGQTIVITGTKFGTYASNATTNVKIGGVTANPAAWSESSITLSVPKGVSSSAGVVVTANGSSSPYPITVNTSEVVIEDVEGGAVGTWNLDFDGDGNKDSGSYPFDLSKDCTYSINASIFKEGAKSFSVKYVYDGADGTSWGGGCGSILTNALDLTGKNTISFWLKGDGTTNEVTLKLKATYGSDEIQLAAPAVKLDGTGWKQYAYSLSKFGTQDKDGKPVNLTPTELANYVKNIAAYNLVYTTTYKNDTDAIHYIDAVKAYYVTPNTPPVASPVTVSTDLNKEVEITLNGTDAEKSPLDYYIVTLPANGGTLNVPVGKISGNKVTFTPKKDATGSDTFTYKVNDGTDDSNTATVTVNISNNAPTAPALSEPAKDATSVAVKPTFKWSAATDKDGDKLNYSLKVSEASDLSSPVVNINTDLTSYPTTSDLKFNTKYYWQVTADDGKGATANSETWVFTTEDSLKVSSVLPAEASLGQTIVISGTNLGASGTVTVGGAATYPVSWKANEIVLAVPSGVSAGAAEVVVTSGTYSSKGSVTVKTDSIMLDDYEGGAAGNFDPASLQPLSGRYVFDKHDPAVSTSPAKSTSYPTAEVVTEGTAKVMKAQYSYGSRTSDPDYDPANDWGGGWGAKLANTYNLTDFNRIKLLLKWDGSANKDAVSLSLKDYDGTAVLAKLSASEFNSSVMSDVVVKKSSFAYAKDSSDASANADFDWTKIVGYNIVYTGKNASSASHLVDNLQAYAVNKDKPELSVTPDSMSFTGYVNGTSTSPETQVITISNAMPDTGEFKFSLAATAAWIVLPLEGTTVNGAAQALVDIDEAKMPAEGTYTAEVTVTAEDGVQSSPQTVLVTLQVKKTTSPTIISLSTTSAPAGARITISGMYFGSSQEQSRVTFTRNGVAGPDGRVISWSDTQIVVETPGTLAVGGYDIEIVRLSVAAEGIKIASKSDPMAYNVSAAGVIGTATIYPNPINPNKGETTTILFDNQGVNNITVYLYDTTARLIKQESLAPGANQTTWNGKDASGSVAGDGVYLVRVVNRDSKSLIAKGKILVIKR